MVESVETVHAQPEPLAFRPGHLEGFGDPHVDVEKAGPDDVVASTNVAALGERQGVEGRIHVLEVLQCVAALRVNGALESGGRTRKKSRRVQSESRRE